MLAFGIATLIISVIAIFVPGFGIMISGVSGVLAWLSAGKGTPLGAAAVIVNFVNIFLLSPAYMVAVGLEASQRSYEENKLFTIWAIVLFIQIGAVVVFLINLALDYGLLPYLEKRKRSTNGQRNPSKSEKLQSQETADTPRQNVPEVTRVLLHKIYGGRKKDSKFWNPENDISIGLHDQYAIQPKETKPGQKRIRRATQTPVYPVAGIFVLAVALFIAAPALMPGWDYRNIKSSVSDLFSDNPITPIPAKAVSYSPPKPSKTVRKPITRPVPRSVKNIPKVSTSGKLFSWRDESGGLHFSNTNYPADNPTLQVQTEINKYSRVTKISIVNNRIYVPVTLQNGSRKITKSMLLDTGASHTIVPYKYLKNLNCKYGKKVTSTIADGSKTTGRQAFVDSIQVGPNIKRNATLTARKVAGSDNRGLLGMDFLKHHPFKIDYENKFLVWM